MAAKLQASCAIFWLIWILAVSYWFGTVIYSKSFVVDGTDVKEIETVMFVVCMVSAVFSFVGCCFTFCDITHFACVLCFALPMVLVVPGFSLYGVIKVQSLDSITDEYVESLVRQHWDDHGRSPRYLTETEVYTGCCGLYGPFDYRKFLYGDRCSSILLDVPYSCCNLENLFKNLSGRRTKQCEIFNKTLFGFPNSSGDLTTEFKCSYVDDPFQPFVLDEFKPMIRNKGCMTHLVDQTNELMSTHFALFCIFTASSFIMLAITIKNGCSAPPWLYKPREEDTSKSHFGDNIESKEAHEVPSSFMKTLTKKNI